MPEATDTASRTYTVEEVADALDRHPESIRRNLRKGQLEGEKWSRQWFVAEDALREWLPEAIYRRHFGQKEEA